MLFSEASVTTRYMKEVVEKSRCINLIHGDVRLLNGTACPAHGLLDKKTMAVVHHVQDVASI